MMEEANKIVDAINKILIENKLSQKEIYEYLLAKGIIEPGNENKFKQIFQMAIDQGYIDVSKVKKWNKKRGKLPRYFTKKQLIQIFEVVDRPKDSIACFMALVGGLRVNEVCKLKVEHINFEQKKINICDSKNTNRARDGYGIDRVVEFDESIEPIIRKWLDIIGRNSEWFLPSDKSPDKPLRTKSLHERFRMYLKEAGLDKVDQSQERTQEINGKNKTFIVNRYLYTFHCFRHTMASIIYNVTGDIYAVNRFLGHKQLDTTMVYAKMNDKKMRTILSDIYSSSQSIQKQSEPVKRGYSVPESSLESLKKKFVNGEIDAEKFKEMKEVLLS